MHILENREYTGCLVNFKTEKLSYKVKHLSLIHISREGCKHRCTNAAMEYFKSEVMEMCHREGLYQIDLLNGSKERITEREYWAAKKGQLALCLLYTSRCV